MAKKNSWDERWERGNRIGGGGHGDTFLVTSRNSADTGQQFVLKMLRNQKSLERRERMHREVRALEKLNHPNIPKIYDANTNDYHNLDVALYFVSEYVEGPTLEQLVESDRLLGLIEAVNLTLNVITIVKHCHANGINHRDIKPDNIILRRGKTEEPFLIDFGQSFNEEDATESRLTNPSQQMGNRFLHLPELESGDSEKQYVESDITQCCGIFFYTLTGINPVHLSDQEGRKPHQRPTPAEIFSAISPDVRRKLFEVFDKGFETKIEDRFRSFGTLRGRLYEILDELKTVSERADMHSYRLEHLYEDILLLIDEMVDRQDYAGVSALSRSFLGLGQPDKALQIVKRMEERGGKEHPNYFLVLANKAYVLNHFGDYQKVIEVTDQLLKELKKRGEPLSAYHALVRANSFMCLGDKNNAIKWVEKAKVLPQYGNEREKSRKLYPAIAEFLTED